MAESFNSFFCSKFIYATRNKNFSVDAALTCAQQVKHLTEELLNSEGTENTLDNETGRLTYKLI